MYASATFFSQWFFILFHDFIPENSKNYLCELNFLAVVRGTVKKAC